MMRAATISAQKKLGRKVDRADPRSWSEAQAYNRLHAFMELFEGRRIHG